MGPGGQSATHTYSPCSLRPPFSRSFGSVHWFFMLLTPLWMHRLRLSGDFLATGPGEQETRPWRGEFLLPPPAGPLLVLPQLPQASMPQSHEFKAGAGSTEGPAQHAGRPGGSGGRVRSESREWGLGQLHTSGPSPSVTHNEQKQTNPGPHHGPGAALGLPCLPEPEHISYGPPTSPLAC